MYSRKQLKAIYDSLSNEDKKAWSSFANYANYQGLYRYLNSYGDKMAYDRIVIALKSTVGDERFNELVANIQDIQVDTGTSDVENTVSTNLESIIENIKTKAIKQILDADNVEVLERAKEVFECAVNITKNQIERLNLLNNINS
ncbi:MAG: hypothetical protein ACJAX4_002148 [Clostridium sp.]|jgi:hypothetical protein